MILRRSSAAACRPKSARRVRVGVERRVSLARHRDMGTQHLKTTPTASEKRGWGTVGSVCPQCRDAAAGWARAASGAGNRWAAIAAAVRRRGSGRSLGGRSLWSVAGAGGKYSRRQAEEAGVTADGRRTGAWSTVGGRRKRRKSRRRQAEEAGNCSTADGRRKRRELRQMVGGRAGADTVGGRRKRRKLRRRQAEEA
jgi:hypothetical protein